jgi:hypothetical protein
MRRPGRVEGIGIPVVVLSCPLSYLLFYCSAGGYCSTVMQGSNGPLRVRL